MRLLLVEDDRTVGTVVLSALGRAGYAVDWTQDGSAALPHLQAGACDALLLDLGLPGMDGMTILKRLRGQRNPVPVVVLSARDSLEERVQGLDAGADDYLVKPFAKEELLARLRAVMRRKSGQPGPQLTNGRIVLDPVTREVSVDGRNLILSPREFTLLEVLMMRPGGIFSRRDIESRIYNCGEDVGSNAIEYIIHSLRQKLGTELIRNVRGMGWMVERAA